VIWDPKIGLVGQARLTRRAGEAIVRIFVRPQSAARIWRLRLAATSGIPTSAGDVAEWLKAAVC
jgi:hypothetical protein